MRALQKIPNMYGFFVSVEDAELLVKLHSAARTVTEEICVWGSKKEELAMEELTKIVAALS